MDAFWLLVGFLVLAIVAAVSGGKDFARGQRLVSIFKISAAVGAVLMTAYLLYLDGLLFAIGEPWTLW